MLRRRFIQTLVGAVAALWAMPLARLPQSLLDPVDGVYYKYRTFTGPLNIHMEGDWYLLNSFLRIDQDLDSARHIYLNGTSFNECSFENVRFFV